MTLKQNIEKKIEMVNQETKKYVLKMLFYQFKKLFFMLKQTRLYIQQQWI